MTKMTLLEMTQNILNDMESDEVNSISDTVESLQVAGIIKETYSFLIDNKVIPEHKQLYTVEGLADSTRPNFLKLPTDATNLVWVKYDKTPSGSNGPQYVEVPYKEPIDFLDLVHNRNIDDTNVISVTDVNSTTKFLVVNDDQPNFWTSFDDEYMVFDSYDSTVDSTLQGSKTVAYGVKEPVFTLSDGFTPDLDSNMFSLLLNEAKSQAFITLKQVSNTKAEQRYRKQLTKLQNDKHRFKVGNPTASQPNYGR